MSGEQLLAWILAVPCLGAAASLGETVERYRIAQILWWSWPRGDLPPVRNRLNG